MADVAVGQGYELDLVAERGPFRGDAARVDFRVVRVRPENDDAQPAARRRGGGKGGRRDGRPLASRDEQETKDEQDTGKAFRHGDPPFRLCAGI